MLNHSRPVAPMSYVYTGELEFGSQGLTLNSGAIGSCVVITVFSRKHHFGIMAHVMLPGRAPQHQQEFKTKYASNAIDEIIHHLEKKAIPCSNVEICIIGGANVLKLENVSIGDDIIHSVTELLFAKQLRINAYNVGGFERRSALLDTQTGDVYYTVGNSEQKTLWQSPIKSH